MTLLALARSMLITGVAAFGGAVAGGVGGLVGVGLGGLVGIAVAVMIHGRLGWLPTQSQREGFLGAALAFTVGLWFSQTVARGFIGLLLLLGLPGVGLILGSGALRNRTRSSDA